MANRKPAGWAKMSQAQRLAVLLRKWARTGMPPLPTAPLCENVSHALFNGGEADHNSEVDEGMCRAFHDLGYENTTWPIGYAPGLPWDARTASGRRRRKLARQIADHLTIHPRRALARAVNKHGEIP